MAILSRLHEALELVQQYGGEGTIKLKMGPRDWTALNNELQQLQRFPQKGDVVITSGRGAVKFSIALDAGLEAVIADLHKRVAELESKVA